MATHADLALLTARSYSVTYVGFVIPLLLAVFHPFASNSTLLLAVAGASLASTFVILRGLAKNGGFTEL